MMIICEYCQTQLPGHSLFCCQCGGKVRLPDETIIYANFGPALRSALKQKRQATIHYVGPGSPRGRDFNNAAVTKKDIHFTWEEDDDDAWI